MKEQNVIEYYVLCNKLKNIIRTGWLDWKVKRKRIESVAEHIFGTQMLALAIYSEYKYEIDIKKVILMLALHELEEIKIGDLTPFQITKEEKKKIGKKAVEDIVKNLNIKEDIDKIIDEFDERITKEALFAHHIDKLECDLQCKLYDEENCVNLNNQEGNTSYHNKEVQEYIKKGDSWSKMWIEFDKKRYNYDKNFNSILDYALENEIKNEEKNNEN